MSFPPTVQLNQDKKEILFRIYMNSQIYLFITFRIEENMLKTKPDNLKQQQQEQQQQLKWKIKHTKGIPKDAKNLH